MKNPGTEWGHSIGFVAFFLSFSANRVVLFTVSLCLSPPGQNLGISNTSIGAPNRQITVLDTGTSSQQLHLVWEVHSVYI